MSGPGPWMITWLAANAGALMLVGLALAGWMRVRPSLRRRALAGALCLAVGVPLLLVLFRPAQVPTAWITVLQEGHSVRNVQQLYGQGAHVGPGFTILIQMLTGHT